MTFKKTNVANFTTGNAVQKSVADELISALSRPKIKNEIKEEILDVSEPNIVEKRTNITNLRNTNTTNTKAEKDKSNKEAIIRLSNKSRSQTSRGLLDERLKAADKILKGKIADNVNDSVNNTVKLSNKSKIVQVKPAKETGSASVSISTKSKVNSDWINFLKKRHDSGPDSGAEAEIIEIDASPKPTKRSVKPKIVSANKIVNAAVEIKSETDGEANKEKDLILKNLMAQVSQLETSMGANISKLETQLKEEKAKTSRLTSELESEKENYSDIATKLISTQQTKLKMEEAHQLKISNMEKSLAEETVKTKTLDSELVKVKDLLEKAEQDKDKAAVEISGLLEINGKLKVEVEQLLIWKEKSLAKIKSSVSFCSDNHVNKINDLLESEKLKNELIVETSARISALIQEYNLKINAKNKDLDTLKSKHEDVLKSVKCKENNIRDLENQLKDKEGKIKEKHENEVKYREKVERYREKEDRYREREERYREKEEKFKDKERKFRDMEKRLRDKEKKFKENDEKLKQKEDEMFRVYELVNQLQQRMKNDKINPIVNGQDILSINKPYKRPRLDEDDDVVCLQSSSKMGVESPTSNKYKDTKQTSVIVNDETKILTQGRKDVSVNEKTDSQSSDKTFPVTKSVSPNISSSSIIIEESTSLSPLLEENEVYASDCASSSTGSVKAVTEKAQDGASSAKTQSSTSMSSSTIPELPEHNAEEEILLVDDEEDDIQCVMEFISNPTSDLSSNTVNKSDSKSLETSKAGGEWLQHSELNYSSKSRMKAADFFQKCDEGGRGGDSYVENEKSCKGESVVLEHWVTEQLKLERRRSDHEYDTEANDGTEMLDNEDKRPTYVNPAIIWKLKLWPNVCERLPKHSSPKYQSEHIEGVSLTVDPRLFGYRDSNDILCANEAKRDLLKSFDSCPEESSQLTSFASYKSYSDEDFHGFDDEAASEVLYGDLDELYQSAGRKRSWTSMSSSELVRERQKILDELKCQLEESRSSLDDSFSDDLIIDGVPERIDNPLKKMKTEASPDMDASKIAKDILDECVSVIVISDVSDGRLYNDTKIHTLSRKSIHTQFRRNIKSSVTKYLARKSTNKYFM